MYKRLRDKLTKVAAVVLIVVVLINQSGLAVKADESSMVEQISENKEQIKEGEKQEAESEMQVQDNNEQETESEMQMQDNSEQETESEMQVQDSEKEAETSMNQDSTEEMEDGGKPGSGENEIQIEDRWEPDETGGLLIMEETDPRVIEVADLTSLVQAVAEVTAEDDRMPAYEFTGDPAAVHEVVWQKNRMELISSFQNKRLIVRSEAGFDPCGAETIIQGYENLFILSFETEDEAKAAYGLLAEDVAIQSVEVDQVFFSSWLDIDSTDGEGHTAAFLKGSRLSKTAVSGRDIVAAVLDSGYDIIGCDTSKIKEGIDFTGAGSILDDNGHGTAVSSVILENSDANVSVMPVKVSDANGRTSALKLYLGIRYAMEQQADIINISLTSYKAAQAQIITEAVNAASDQGIFVVTAAGNAGDNTADYTPANAEAAIVVSAVNTDGSAMDYSNHGDTVDFSSYGKVMTRSIGGQETEAEGTSISAAVITLFIAEAKSMNPNISYGEVEELMKKYSKDLGDEGKDPVYGHGAILPEHIHALYENNVWQTAELLACDWKNLSDEALEVIFEKTSDITLNRFLGDLSEEERTQLLDRNTSLTGEYTVWLGNMAGGKMQETVYPSYYGYLMENDFTSAWYSSSDMASGYFTIGFDSDLNNRTVSLDYGVSLSNLPTTKDDNDHTDVKITSNKWKGGLIGGTKFPGLSDFKITNGINDNHVYFGMRLSIPSRKHSRITYTRNIAGGTNGAGITTTLPKDCTKGSTTTSNVGCQVAFNEAGIKIDTMPTHHATITIKTRQNKEKAMRKEPTCTKTGKDTFQCSECKEKQEETLPALDHLWLGIINYEPDNGILNGARFEQCQRNCGESGWRRNYEYLQQTLVRYMDENENFGGYGHVLNDYYGAGASVPGWSRPEQSPTDCYKAAEIGAYGCPGAALINYIDAVRKRYSVVYHGNGAEGGTTAAQINICVGRSFILSENGFTRRGYEFDGWAIATGGSRAYNKNASVTNLSYADGAVVNLYAVWKPGIFRITLDNQGADTKGTQKVYERYTIGYFKTEEVSEAFNSGRIICPEKSIEDTALIGGNRRMQFLGYYTGKNGTGDSMVQKDGFLIANMAGRGNYRYFASDATVYAHWINKNAVQFSDNLTDRDIEIVGTGKNTVPDTKWKVKGEDITVEYESASIVNSSFTQIYRLKGWSLMQEISSEDEIILSDEKPSYTFTEDADVTLYAQWDTSYNVTYVGNQQSEGMDYMDGVSSVLDGYVFTPNEKEEVAALENPEADYFIRTVRKATIDIATGESMDADGNAYMETLPYSFRGWSMYKDKKEQENHPRVKYRKEDGEQISKEVVISAEEVANTSQNLGLTMGEPVADYGRYNAVHDRTKNLMGGVKGKSISEYTVDDVVKSYAAKISETPFVNMYAIWDQYPQILANDLYFPLVYAQNGTVTEEYLLNQASASDEELKSDDNADGRLKNGEDTQNHTFFDIPDYQESDFLGAEGDMAMTITYRAEDAVGNVIRKLVTVYFVDTMAKDFDAGSVRFISAEYADTLSEGSIWRTGEYATRLAQVLGNRKSGEEYTEVSPLEQAFGAKSVKKPGSGTWDRVQQVWEFTHTQVLDVQAYVKSSGIEGSQDGFLARFGSSRVK